MPHDVILYIVEYLQDDHKSLRACSLTCRSWHGASQPLLFFCLVLTGQVRLSLLEEYIRDSLVVAAWVKKLEIDRSIHNDTDAGNALLASGPSWFYQLAPKLSGLLNNLTTLHFSHITEAGLKPTATLFHGLAAFKQVRSLILHDCFITDRVLFAFVAAFPSVEDFSLRTHHRHAEVGPDVPFLHSPRLISLDIDIAINPYDTVTPFMQWLSITPSVQTLRSVRIRNVAGRLVMDGSICVAARVSEFLKKCSGLTHIGLGFVAQNVLTRGLDSEAAFGTYIDLAHNPALASVELKDPANGLMVGNLLYSPIYLRLVSIVIDTPLIDPILFTHYHSDVVKAVGTTLVGLEEIRLVNVVKSCEELVQRIYRPLFERGLAKLMTQEESYSYSRDSS